MIGDKIKALRAEKGWSMRKLADEAGIDASMISDYEKKGVIPRDQAIFKLAKAFGVKKEVILEDEDVNSNSFDPKLFNQLLNQLPDLDEKAKTSLIPIFVYYTEQKAIRDLVLNSYKGKNTV